MPYSCLPVLDWETVGAICSLSFRADRPMKVDIGVPVVVKLRPVTGLFGQRGAVAYDSSMIYDGLAVNIPALEQLEKVGEVAVEVADVAVDIPVLAQFERVGGIAVEVADVAVDIPILEQFERVGGIAVEVADVAVDIPVLAQFGKVGDVAVEVADVTTGASGIGESVSWGVVDVEDFPIGDHSAILQLGLIHDDTAHKINLWLQSSGQGSVESNIAGTFQFLAFYTDGNSEVIHTALMPDIDNRQDPRWFRFRPDLGWVGQANPPNANTPMSFASNLDLDAAKTLSRIRVNYPAP